MLPVQLRPVEGSREDVTDAAPEAVQLTIHHIQVRLLLHLLSLDFDAVLDIVLDDVLDVFLKLNLFLHH